MRERHLCTIEDSPSIRSLHEDRLADSSSRLRHRRGPPGQERRRRPVPLTGDGFPAATPDAPKLSPFVLVSSESQERYPWLPRRVIAGSVWHGPQQVRVRIDQNGEATGWRRVASPRR